VTIELPAGVTVGHWTDRQGWTGCTAVVAPPGAVCAGEVHGGAPGTREFSLLSPATSTPGAQVLVLAGGSAFGLAAAEGAVTWLAEHGRGYATVGGRVPLVAAAVVYDLGLGDPLARPGAAEGYAACAAAGPAFERGSVGAGTGCTAGNLLGPASRTKTGLGAASRRAGVAVVAALAVANPVGDVIAADGSVLAGVWRDGAYRRTVDLLAEGFRADPGTPAARANTTLVCLLTDARLTKTEAWLTARSATAGVARAVAPAATLHDGDVVTCLATGGAEADPFVVSALGAEVVAAAIRDAAVSATGAPGCPAAAERSGEGVGGGRRTGL
jgi:L-aminopeptidase/D-esterase-like protein